MIRADIIHDNTTPLTLSLSKGAGATVVQTPFDRLRVSGLGLGIRET